nr:immunoglobulin heavy chain junction region [Mus musculus]
CAISWFAYW